MRNCQTLRRGCWLSPLLLVGLLTAGLHNHPAAADTTNENGLDVIAGQEAEDGLPYVVEEGDTLWDISNRTLGSPWYWPQVWSFNPEIANPHWIYPGNVIRIVAPTEGPLQVADTHEGMEMRGLPQREDVVSVMGELSYVVPRSVNVLDQGFITREELEGVGRVEAAFEEKMLLTRFDRVYVQVPDAVVGQRYVVFRTGGEVRNPRTGELYGYRTEKLGELTLTEVPPRGLATAVIGDTLDAVERGDHLIPWQEGFTRKINVRENHVDLDGHIIASFVPRMRIFAQNQYVHVDLGSIDGVQQGNTVEVVRRGDPLAAYVSAPVDEEMIPWETVGELLMVDVQEDTSVGLVIRSLRELEAGEKVRMRVGGGRHHAGL